MAAMKTPFSPTVRTLEAFKYPALSDGIFNFFKLILYLWYVHGLPNLALMEIRASTYSLSKQFTAVSS